MSLFLGKSYVLSLQEQYGDVFDPVRKRIRQSEGMICRHGPDYLVYALIDAVLDGYYPVIEMLGDRLHDAFVAVGLNSARTIPFHGSGRSEGCNCLEAESS